MRSLALFTERFADDEKRNVMWRAFLRRIRWKEAIDFRVVMDCIKENLEVFWSRDVLG